MNSSYVFTNDLRFHYLQWNRDGDGRPVVLHHGLASNANIWRLVAPILAEAGCCVYAPDARGHGLTDKPDKGYDFDTVTIDLASFIDHCRLEQPVLIGHSWGAGVVLHYAARFAIGPRAPAGIVLVDGGVTEMDDGRSTWEETRQRLTPPKLAGMKVDEFEQRLRQWTADWNPPEEAIQTYMASFEVDEDERITPRLTLEHHLAILEAVWGFKTYAEFSRLRCPVLALPCRPAQTGSEKDQTYQEMKETGVQRLLQSGAHAQVHWMDGAIHDVPLQRPSELAQEILRFIRSL